MNKITFIEATEDSNFVDEVKKECGVDVSLCFHCRKCTNGCLLVEEMDYPPNKIMRMVQLGLRDDVLKSHTIWVCASCWTCSTRCPNDIDVAKVMDGLRRISIRENKVNPSDRNTLLFHQIFLDWVKRYGRVFELGLIGSYKMKTKEFTKDMKLGITMFRKGKIKFLPEKIKATREIKEIFGERG